MQTTTQKRRGATVNRPQYKTHSHCKQSGSFTKAALPHASDYFAQQGLKLTGGGEWKNAVCPFHDDTKPSLRIHIDTGAFRCMVCGAHGGDVLAFHQQRYGLSFKQAAQQLGAWRLA